MVASEFAQSIAAFRTCHASLGTYLRQGGHEGILLTFANVAGPSKAAASPAGSGVGRKILD